MSPATTTANKRNSTFQILIASLIGTTIEFFDFYVFATAAALFFPQLFFPNGNAAAAQLQSFAVFAAAFIARPVGSVLFGHFGDKVGRKTTLVAALLCMGISTVLIGFLPTYNTTIGGVQFGWWAPFLLILCRIGQGIGLGGEWGGAVLLATENAPKEKRGRYAMFPQLGAPIGLFLSAGTFWIMLRFFSENQLLSWGWRIPFLVSIVLIVIGLWVRLTISETAEFKKAVAREERVKYPIVDVVLKYPRALILGSFAAMATFVLFHMFTAYLLSYTQTVMHLPLHQALEIELAGAIFFCLLIPVSGYLSDIVGRRRLMMLVTLSIGLFSFTMPWFLDHGVWGAFGLSMAGLGIMGMTYGPIGAVLASPFPTALRYTGASITFNLAGILGGSFAPYISTLLMQKYNDTAYLGYYLLASALISLLCLFLFSNREISS
ncbi:MAG: MFS transporter, metabolite:H+ symporter (MHS)family protein [Candidatus Tokpelaia hoelldobleri]|uniref:MFS transporter, metabolite:H+ symporter (MHS)family protein n=1 Tax=Candidatus Tokpelaia hoelldobleri TaxID=1902579 RepID=A0A1U9JUL4_9HYPH|nr:MAG: MFS transporter, metabolite:H+ symporter (MHS)family protein [Candidatus Tokpelaia hoelldoblerii]